MTEANGFPGIALYTESPYREKRAGPSRLAQHSIAIPARRVHSVANKATTTAAMTSVASQPITQSGSGRVNGPITFFCVAITMMITMTGTATTPLMTALQKSALIGSIGEKLMPTPSSVAMAMVA